MVKNSAEKKANRAIMAFFNVPYRIAKEVNAGDRCAFCNMTIKKDADGWILESNGEVGEFWSNTLQNSLLAHPDCLPNGIDVVITGKDPEWSMA
jgi:hypothetical protein